MQTRTNAQSLSDSLLPYNLSEDVTLSLTNLNDVATAYIVNKIFYRLLANDLFLGQYRLVSPNALSIINPFLSGNTYEQGSRIIANSKNLYSTDPNKKFQILTSVSTATRERPTSENIAPYSDPETDIEELRKRGIHWKQDLINIDKLDPFMRKNLARRPLDQTIIPSLSSYIKTDYILKNDVAEGEDLDYVVSAGYSKAPMIIQASNTTWTKDNRLPASETCKSEFYSWFRIYKSGYTEIGGVTEPFSLSEQWNGKNTKTAITIKFPVNIDCINLKYNFMTSSKNNFMTKYDSRFNLPTLVLYQITQGRRSAENYKFSNIASNINALPGNCISQITNDNFTIFLSNESFDLDNTAVGMSDAALTKVSWKATGILKA